MSGDVVRWVKGHPTKPGQYFRTTLWGKVIYQDVGEINGELVVCMNQGTKRMSRTPEDWWWFGPVPPPPEDADVVRRQKLLRSAK